MPRDLSNAVVVITGASTGIGRAAARAFAKKGARLVLAARQEQALNAALDECRAAGAEGIAVPCDVADDEQVKRIAARALETFGRIDVWVNNAAVSAFGRFEETPREAWEQVVRINLFGYANGARYALRQFREQGEGVLINVSSMVGKVGQPYTSAYIASKWAICGFSESLRMELMDEPDIHVSTVLPAAIDTPIFQHAANYLGREAKAMTPLYPPEQVAAVILAMARHPKREVYAGNSGKLLAWFRTVAPPFAESFMARQVEENHFWDRDAPRSDGNLFEPANDGEGCASGGWQERLEEQEEEESGGSGFGIAAAAGLAVAVAVPAVIFMLRQRDR